MAAGMHGDEGGYGRSVLIEWMLLAAIASFSLPMWGARCGIAPYGVCEQARV